MVHQALARVLREWPKPASDKKYFGNVHSRVAKLGGNVILQIGFLENSDIRHVAIQILIIQSVANNKFIWYFKHNKVRHRSHRALPEFIEKYSRLNRLWAHIVKPFRNLNQCLARIKNIINEQDITVFDIEHHMVMNDQVTRLSPTSVRGGLNQANANRHFKESNQVCKHYETSSHDRNDGQRLILVMLLELGSQAIDSESNLRFIDEDFQDFYRGLCFGKTISSKQKSLPGWSTM